MIFASTIGEVIGARKPDVNGFPEWANSCIVAVNFGAIICLFVFRLNLPVMLAHFQLNFWAAFPFTSSLSFFSSCPFDVLKPASSLA